MNKYNNYFIQDINKIINENNINDKIKEIINLYDKMNQTNNKDKIKKEVTNINQKEEKNSTISKDIKDTPD